MKTTARVGFLILIVICFCPNVFADGKFFYREQIPAGNPIPESISDFSQRQRNHDAANEYYNKLLADTFENMPSEMMFCKFKSTLTSQQMKNDIVFENAKNNSQYRELKIRWTK